MNQPIHSSLDLSAPADLLPAIVDVAHTAGAMIRQHFGTPQSLRSKGDRDFVTEVDLAAEQLIRTELTDRIPGITIVGEEYGGGASNGLVAYVDPIDGTSNFIDGIPFYAVSIGVALGDELVAGVVYDPEREETFSAAPEQAELNGAAIRCRGGSLDEYASVAMTWPYESANVSSAELKLQTDLLSAFRSIRRLGSAALGLAYVAAGRVDLASELAAHPWDVAAGFLLVEAAGGTVARPRAVISQSESTPRWFSQRYVAHSHDFSLSQSQAKAIIEI